MVSEASWVCNLSGQKFIENAKNSQFGEDLKTEACGQIVLPDRAQIGGKCQNWKINMRHFE